LFALPITEIRGAGAVGDVVLPNRWRIGGFELPEEEAFALAAGLGFDMWHRRLADV
jgi:hypothetical protein